MDEVRDDDSPCGPWPVDLTCCPGWPEDPADWQPEHHLAVEIATDVLWRLTGGRYGLCEELIRPCRTACSSGRGGALAWGAGGLLSPTLGPGGRWTNGGGCGCRSGCSCRPLCAIDLPGPVHEVLEVRLSGHVLPVSAWTVHRVPAGGRLVRTDGGCWPDCQDMTRPDTDPDTMSVRYLMGREVPAAGRRAAGQLACEVFKQCTRASGCALPAGVKTVTREGVSYEIVPPGDWPETLRMHLPQVWAWVQLAAPQPGATRPALYSLDLPGPPLAARYRPGGRL